MLAHLQLGDVQVVTGCHAHPTCLQPRQDLEKTTDACFSDPASFSGVAPSAGDAGDTDDTSMRCLVSGHMPLACILISPCMSFHLSNHILSKVEIFDVLLED